MNNDTDILEQAYWDFDAARKGNGLYKGRPQAERDAFKAQLRRIQNMAKAPPPPAPPAPRIIKEGVAVVIQKEPICSFCGADVHRAKILISGRGGFICDNCIAGCLEIAIAKIAELQKGEHIIIRLARSFSWLNPFRKKEHKEKP